MALMKDRVVASIQLTIADQNKFSAQFLGSIADRDSGLRSAQGLTEGNQIREAPNLFFQFPIYQFNRARIETRTRHLEEVTPLIACGGCKLRASDIQLHFAVAFEDRPGFV